MCDLQLSAEGIKKLNNSKILINNNMKKHNFPSDTNIVCFEKLNEEQVIEILHLAIDHNIKFPKYIIETKVDKLYPYLMWNCNELNQTSRTQKEYPSDIWVTFEEFKMFCIGKGKYKKAFTQTLKLNKDYSAVVTKQSIKVGCQTFDHSIIKQLYTLSQKALKS